MSSDQQLSQEQQQRFHEQGFLNAGNVLAQDDVESLADELARIIAKGPQGFREGEPRPVRYAALGGDSDRPVWQIVDIWMASPIFERLIHHPFIARAVGDLTGSSDLQVWHDQVQYKPPLAGGSTSWHQDAPYWPAIEPMSEVSAWIPFDDADEANGCMWMVPGSHRWGNQIDYLHRQGDQHAQGKDFTLLDAFTVPEDRDPGLGVITPDPVPCPVKRGEVHFHHALTWHGSPHNRSNRPRRAIAIHFMTGEAVYTGREHLMSKYIKIGVGERMANAGDVFPFVLRDGTPV